MKSSETKLRMIWLHVCMDCKMWLWLWLNEYSIYIYIWHAFIYFLHGNLRAFLMYVQVINLCCVCINALILENTTWKIGGANPMSWFIMASFGSGDRHLLSPQCKMLVPTAPTKKRCHVANRPARLGHLLRSRDGTACTDPCKTHLRLSIFAMWESWAMRYIGPQKETIVFQASIFWLELLVSGGYTVKSWLIFSGLCN